MPFITVHSLTENKTELFTGQHKQNSADLQFLTQV